MNVNRRRLILSLTAGMLSPQAFAQSWPTHPLRWIVPFAPGGSTDVFSRLTAERLAKLLGQAVVVENVSGASGTIGLMRIARAKPDGYTIGTIPNSLLTMSPHTATTALNYDAMKDFTPIAGVATFQYVVSVAPNSRFKSLAELLEYGRRHPGELMWGTTGVGTGNQLAGVLLSRKTGTQFTEVPYKGGAEYLNALMSGQVDFVIDPVGGSIGLIRAGKIRALATTGASRASLLPEVPSVADTVSDMDHIGWFGVYGPRGLDAQVVEGLYAGIQQAQKAEDFQQRLQKLGYELMTSCPSELQVRAKAEYDMWGSILRKSS